MKSKLLRKQLCLLLSIIFIIQIVCVNTTASTIEDLQISNVNLPNSESISEITKRNTSEESFTALVSGILANNGNSSRSQLNQLSKSCVWLSESAREQVLNLFNTYSDNIYDVSDDGYLFLKQSKEKSLNSLTSFYSQKINELINNEKTVIISVENTYNVTSEYDGSIMPMMMEKGDFALLFSNEDDLDVVVLNSYNYIDNTEEYHEVELLNRLLEVFYNNDESFKEYSTKIPEDAISMFTVEEKPGVAFRNNIPDVNLGNYNLDMLNDYNVSLIGIFNDALNLENDLINIENFIPKESGIFVEKQSATAFLTYLNNHGIYTYSIDENGKLLCDGVMKSNPYLDFTSETEVDIIIKKALECDYKLTIGVKNNYLSVTGSNVIQHYFKEDEYIVAFDNADKTSRTVTLNEAYFNENMGLNYPVSDYFVKELLYKETGINALAYYSGIGKMVSGRTVYAGPSTSNYFSVGSVSTDEYVAILYKTSGWYCIAYAVGQTNNMKTGFVPIDSVTDINGEIYEKNYGGGYNYSNVNLTVKSYDVFEQALDVGTIYAGEGFTMLQYSSSINGSTSELVAYVEFSTPSGTKRGYVPYGNIIAFDYKSEVARVLTTSTGIYSGSDSSYVKLGGAYLNEYVSVLAEKDGWLFVEYNTSSGRKRGFAPSKSFEKQSYRVLPAPGSGTDLKKATTGLTVYGGPNPNYANIGSIFNQEIVSQISTERGYSYIEYTTSKGAKRGYVLSTSLVTAIAPTIPNIPTYNNFTRGVYGKSGLGKDLPYYKIGNGFNVAFAVFEQHGWEDAWASDGVELINIANNVMNIFSDGDQSIFDNWTLYVIPYANPDGITNGYTNNGVGRCTYTTKTDMNRCWPASFVANYTSRNYTGAEPLGAPEASALEGFLSSKMNVSGKKVLLDIHGWLNKTYGNAEIGAYFGQQFGFSHNNANGSGYLQTWATHNGLKSCLVELPNPSNSSSIIANDYAGKLTQGIRNMLTGTFIENVPEGGQDVNEVCVVTTTSSVRVRSGPGTSYDIVTSLTNGTNVTRIKKNVSTANGYVWDKILLSDGMVGYIATNYLVYKDTSLPNGYEKYDIYDEMVVVKAYLKHTTDYYNGILDTEYSNDLINALELYAIQRNLSVQDGSLNSEILNSMGFSVDINGKIVEDEYYDYFYLIYQTYRYCASYTDEDKNLYVFNKKKTDTDSAYNSLKKSRDELWGQMSEDEREAKAESLYETKRKIDEGSQAMADAFPKASSALGRFGDNSKLGQELDFGDISSIFSIQSQLELRNKIIEQNMRAAESFTSYVDSASFCMDKYLNDSIGVSLTNVLSNEGMKRLDWFMAANAFKLGTSGEIVKGSDNKYTMTLTFKLKDYYDWASGEDEDAMTFPVNVKAIPRINEDGYDIVYLEYVNEAELYDLHYAGMGKNFESKGVYTVKVTWEYGASIDRATIKVI